jgi:polysaccharide deacetylase 2 family uncharacterized protein YibQ
MPERSARMRLGRALSPLVLVILLTLPAAAEQRVRIAIIIDDLGNSRMLGDRALALPGAVTYSVLPHLPHSRRIARRAYADGKEVMLHLPMQTHDDRTLGPGGLRVEMTREELAREVRANLATVPHVVGVNNHMGSLLTRQSGAMRWLMEELSCVGDLYFVDSRTDIRTVARKFAREAGLPNAQRDIFLDNQRDADYVRRQFERLIGQAQQRGSAIGIGHPYPETLAVLAEELPRLADQGVELVPVSRLVETNRSKKLWHACSSPLQTVAKNSRQ